MATVIAKTEALAVYEDSLGTAYVCPIASPTYEDKNALIQELRSRLLAISPDALRLAKAYSRVCAYTSPDMARARSRVRSGKVPDME